MSGKLNMIAMDKIIILFFFFFCLFERYSNQNMGFYLRKVRAKQQKWKVKNLTKTKRNYLRIEHKIKRKKKKEDEYISRLDH